MTAAYTQALLLSAKREREPKARTTQFNAADQRYRARAANYTRPNGGAGFSFANRDDSSRFDHREWDKQHYGLKGETAEARQSEYIRNLARAQRMRSQAAAGARMHRQQAGHQARNGGASFFGFLASVAVCVSVWSAVWQTNKYAWQGNKNLQYQEGPTTRTTKPKGAGVGGRR